MKNKTFREYLESDTSTIFSACAANSMHMHSHVHRGVRGCTHQCGLFLVLCCRTPGPCYFNSKIKAIMLIQAGGEKLERR